MSGSSVRKSLSRPPAFAVGIFFGAVTMAVSFFGVIFYLTRNPAAAIFALVILGGGLHVLRRFMLNMPHASDVEPLESLWGNGTDLFAGEWVLDLSVEVPKVVTTATSMIEFRQQLEGYYETAKAAVLHFSEGKYLIGRDGSMRMIGGGEAAQLSERLLQVSAGIEFADLPYLDTLMRRLMSKPTTSIERAKNCVLLDVHAHGTAKKGFGADSHAMPRFAARDGKIIVESI